MKNRMLDDTVIEVEASCTHQDACDNEGSTCISPTGTTLPHAQQAPEQQECTEEMKEAITEDVTMFICSSVKRVPLQELMKEGFIKKACDSNTNEDASEEDRASEPATRLWLL